MSHAAQSLDVAADTQEELSEWVAKIREATQNADARVRGTGVQQVVVDILISRRWKGVGGDSCPIFMMD